MWTSFLTITAAAALGAGLLSASAIEAAPTTVRVTITNLAPFDGTNLTPFWVGFHDGTFDLYNRGESVQNAAFDGLESLAEDGETAGVSARFAAEAAGGVDATLLDPADPPIRPGETVSFVFNLESTDAATQYFSYASMIIPSNDAFIANGNPLAFDIFDDAGGFAGADFIVFGDAVLDAGTEVNDEAEATTAFLGQSAANTGIDENGVVATHPGFLQVGGRILAAFPGADFTVPGYQVARIVVSQVPEPGTLALASGLFAGLILLARRPRRTAATGA